MDTSFKFKGPRPEKGPRDYSDLKVRKDWRDRKDYDLDDFKNEYDEIKAQFSPRTWYNIKRISKYFLVYWPQVIILLFCVSLTSAASIIPTLLIRQIVDSALPSRNMKLLGLLSIASIAFTAASQLIGVLINYLNNWVGFRVIHDIRMQMFRRMQGMPLSFFTQVPTGEVISRINNDVGGIQSVSLNTFTSIITDIIHIVMVLATMLKLNWKLTLIGMGVIPFLLIPTRYMSRLRWSVTMLRQIKTAKLNSFMYDRLNISGIVLSKLFVRKNEEARQFKKDSLDLAELQLKVNLSGRWFKMAISTISRVGPSLIYWYGGLLFAKGEISLGTIIAMVSFLNRLYNPITALANVHVEITRSTAIFDRVFEYLDLEEEEPAKKSLIEMPTIKGRIQFKDVNFSYNPEQQILEGINFEINPGQLTALVGPSGAGKSTITHLIPKLYLPDNGIIEIDNIDISKVTVDSLRSQIGVVSQDVFLFHTTIRDNLLYAKPDATHEEIVNACKAAYIHDFIMSLPDQYDTLVGQRGLTLSGGEKQRVALARVILSNPRILILDEATSSLDSHSEMLIQKAIQPLLRERTSIVIAHRLSTIIAADQILVIEGGRIVERGKHSELLQQGDLYAQLYNEQFNVHERAQ